MNDVLRSANLHVTDWKALTPAESLHYADVDLEYHVYEPYGGQQHSNGRAVFYLHGLGGHPLENEGGLHFLASKGYTVFAMQQPGTELLYRLSNNPMVVPSWIGAFNAGTVLKCLWNGYRVVDQIAAWWGFDLVDVVGWSYGGMVAALFAAHSPRAHRVLCLNSSLDIPDVIRNFPLLMENAGLRWLVSATTALQRWRADGMEWNRGPYASLYGEISAWRRPANPDVRVSFLCNQEDPLMRAEPLREAARLARENGMSGIAVHFLPPPEDRHFLCLDSVGGFDGACWHHLIALK